MSWKLVTSYALTALAFSLTGCGTINNLPEKDPIFFGHATRMPYGGVEMDAVGGAKLVNAALEGKGTDIALLPVAGYMLLIDLPLSAVGDTLTLPYVLMMGPSGLPPLPPIPPYSEPTPKPDS
jgi:uncharacterized protein YceK